MGALISLLANRRKQSDIVKELKEDNARLEARILSLSKEASGLKTEIAEIADTTSWEMIEMPVQKLRFGTDLPECPLPNQIASAYPLSHGQQVKLKKVLGDIHDQNFSQDT
ncbi:hypothetical protein ACROYT_G030360 [Oculina patagonica]